MKSTQIALGVLMVLVCGTRQVSGQAGPPKFEEVRTPTSPAFTILGITPAQVEHPGTPAAFAVSFLGAFGTSGDEIDNFALETTPYWWGRRPRLTFEAYQARGLRSLYQDLSMSFAVTDSAPAGREAPEGFRRMGFGVRIPVLTGRQQAPECVDTLTARLGRVRALATAKLADSLARPENRARLGVDSTIIDRLYEQAVADALGADSVLISDENLEQCAAELRVRQGFILDLAAGTGVHFEGARAESAEFGSLGFWVTPAYLTRTGGFAGVLRAQWQDLDLEQSTTTYDAGLRGIRAMDRWILSGEAVVRRLNGGETNSNLVRLSGIFDLEITPKTWLTITVGRDFNAAERQSLLALVNFQWNLGNTKPDRPQGLIRE